FEKNAGGFVRQLARAEQRGRQRGHENEEREQRHQNRHGDVTGDRPALVDVEAFEGVVEDAPDAFHGRTYRTPRNKGNRPPEPVRRPSRRTGSGGSRRRASRLPRATASRGRRRRSRS